MQGTYVVSNQDSGSSVLCTSVIVFAFVVLLGCKDSSTPNVVSSQTNSDAAITNDDSSSEDVNANSDVGLDTPTSAAQGRGSSVLPEDGSFPAIPDSLSPIEPSSVTDQSDDAVVPDEIQRLQFSDETFFTHLTTYPKASVRMDLIEKLWIRGESDESKQKVLAGLRLLLKDPDSEVRKKAIYKLRSLIEQELNASASVPELITNLKHEDENVVRASVTCLKLIGDQAQDAVPHLVWLLFQDFQSSQIKEGTCSTLLAIGKPVAKAVPDLKRFVRESGGSQARIDAIGVIASSGDEAYLLKLINDSGMRGSALEAAVHLPTHSPAMVEALKKYAGEDESSYHRCDAFAALANVRPTTQEIASLIAAGINGDGPGLTEAAAKALGKIDPQFDSARDALVAGTKLPDRWDSEACKEALAKYQDTTSTLFEQMVAEASESGEFTIDRNAVVDSLNEFQEIVEDDSKDDLHRAVALMALGAIRYDSKAPEGFKDRLAQLQNECVKVNDATNLQLAALKNNFRADEALESEAIDQIVITGISEATLVELRKFAISECKNRNLTTAVDHLTKVAIAANVDRSVRGEALEALASMGEEAAGALPQIVKSYEDLPSEAKQLAIHFFGEYGSQHDLTMPLIQNALKDEESYATAVRSLAKLTYKQSLNPQQLLDAIETGLSNDWLDIRYMEFATKYLQEDAAPLVGRLIDGLKAQESDVDRMSFVYSLRHIGPVASGATPVLIDIIEKQRPQMKGVVLRAIANIGGPGEALAPIATTLIDDVDLRKDAFLALAGVGESAKAALPAVERFLSADSDREDRWHAILAYGGMGQAGRDLGKRWQQFAESSDSTDRLAASIVLFRLFPDNSKVQAFAISKLKQTRDGEIYKLILGMLHDLPRFRKLARESDDARLNEMERLIAENIESRLQNL